MKEQYSKPTVDRREFMIGVFGDYGAEPLLPVDRLDRHGELHHE